MRCLSLAEGLRAGGHEVELMTADLEVEWLVDAVRDAGLPVRSCARDELDPAVIEGIAPDWLVVDSYTIPSDAISRASRVAPVLAIIDGDSRGIDATMYLDQNLGAGPPARLPRKGATTLLGADYSLIRDAILRERRAHPWIPPGELPRVLCFLGGNDATGAGLPLAEGLARIDEPFALTFVAPPAQHPELSRILSARPGLKLVVPTPALPKLLSATDVLVCAAGTSLWEACTLGIPSVAVSIVDNQQSSMLRAVEGGLTLGFDAYVDSATVPWNTARAVSRLLRDPLLRESFSATARRIFDGDGKHRVTMELASQHRFANGFS
jgi:spore coat polysaccharide biosynthesis predicted glycosyltransferase SpsG